MPTLQSGMAPISQSWSKYTKIIREKVSHSPVYVSHSYHLGVALVGNATPKRGFSDKNVSFLWCFSKISNFRFFIIRSCFCSRVVSLFGSSELPGCPFWGDAKRTKGGSILVMLPLYITFVNQFSDSIFRTPSTIAFVKKLYQ